MEPKLLTADRFVDTENGCSYRYVLSNTEYFRPHFHDYFELFIMLKGNCRHLVNGKDIPLSKGNAVFIRPNDTHDYICVGKKPFSMLNITFTAETAKNMFDYLGDGFPSAELLSSVLPPQIMLSDIEFERFENKMETVCAISTSDHKKTGIALKTLLLDFFVRNFDDIEEGSGSSPLWFEELCDAMKKNGNFSFGIERMTELSGKTREHLSRCMKKYTGKTLTGFINDLRLEYIANMLVNSNHKITDIIFESGFGNISSASKLFNIKFGMSMREYRNSGS